MFKKFIWLLIFFCLNGLLIGCISENFSYAEGNEVEKDRLLIVYDSRNHFADIQDSVTVVRELLGHFNVSVDEIRQDEYRVGDLAYYDYIFVIDVRSNMENEDFISDLAKTNKTICWMGKDLDALLKEKSEYSIDYLGSHFDFLSVSYKKNGDEGMAVSYTLPVKKEYAKVKVLSEDVKIYSWLNTGSVKYPYILNDSNLWYVSRVDLEKKMLFIFADVLFEILPPKFEESQKVYLRIEDVHPFRDTKKLMEIADFLYEKDIPFMVAVIPAYKAENSNTMNLLGEFPEMVEALKYMQDRGGTILLHGYSHEVFGRDVTGEGYEYWNGYENEPLKRDIGDWVEKTVGAGIEEMVENGIYPLGFEAPHYAMSQEGYKQLKKHFSTYSGQLQSSDWGFSTTAIPYVVSDTELFNMLLPENLGFIESGNSGAVEKIKEDYATIQISRSYLAGCFFHPYIDIGYLEEMINFFESEDVEFYDMREEDHWVKADGYEIHSSGGEIFFSKPENMENENDNEIVDFANYGKIVSWIMTAVLLFALGIFVAIFLKAREKTRQNMKG